MMKIELADLNYQDTYELIVNAIVPRPIAWVSTVDEHGIFNLAPFSAYCIVSMKPAMVGFCVASGREGQKKDTLRNIELTEQFVISNVTEGLAEPMNLTSALFPADVDEFKEAGLIPKKADRSEAPIVAESPISFECQLNQILKFGEVPRISSYVIGEILIVHIKDEFYINGEPQTSEMKAIGRLGGDLYCRTTVIFEMKRPR